MHRLFAGLILIVIACVLLPVPAAAQMNPSGAAYAPPGPYPVGVMHVTLDDPERPLDVTIWYPASQTESDPAPLQYTWAGFDIATGFAQPGAAPDPDGAPYPLVIFSHGLAGFRLQSVFFTEHLASYGFVVMAADHPGSTLTDMLGLEAGADLENGIDASNGSGTSTSSQLEESALSVLPGTVLGLSASVANRPFEILCEIDFGAALSADGAALAGMIDTDRTAVTGHSLGGFTALSAAGARLDVSALDAWCRRPTEVSFNPARDPAFRIRVMPRSTSLSVNCSIRLLAPVIAEQRGLPGVPGSLWPSTTDPRIRAVIALAPWNGSVFGAEGLAALDVPAMIQVGSGDDVTPPGQDAYTIYTGISSPVKALVVLEHAGHVVFAEQMRAVVETAWRLDDAHPLINHFATAFLLAVLKDDEAARASLDTGPNPFPEVLYDAQLAS